jgi:hypothetical protein
LMASDVNRPREMKIGMASLLEYFAYLIERKSGHLRAGCHGVEIQPA